MRLDRLKTFALAQPQTTVVKQWGECLVFKVAGKMFLILVLDGAVIEGVVFKCTPEEFDELTQIDGIGQAPYCAKRLWVKVADLAALPQRELQQRIQASYRLVVAKLPKKTRLGLGL
jgi:predicted DNA-binding protein (MmcQ/YjbR family)